MGQVDSIDCKFLFLQGHLFSSQRFVFWIVFVFVVIVSVKCARDVCFLNFFRWLQSKVERLMCEVEFWEVFYVRCEVYYSGDLNPLVDCQIANLQIVATWIC